jgi:hypothetical protein
MTRQNSVNTDIQNNVDGLQISGGIVKRILKWLGADITLTGSGTNTYTFPTASDLLVGTTQFLDGWVACSETWTIADPWSCTVSGDVTAKYTFGTRVRYKDGGDYEYGHIISSTYSAPNTTVYLAPNIDYAIGIGTITDRYISSIDMPYGYPSYFSFTPFLNNVNIAGGTVTGRFSIIGKLVKVQTYTTFGTATPVSGSVTEQIPVGTMTGSAVQPLGVAVFGDVSPAAQYAGIVNISSSTLILYRTFVVGTTYITQATISATIPFTWASGDRIMCEYAYFLA